MLVLRSVIIAQRDTRTIDRPALIRVNGCPSGMTYLVLHYLTRIGHRSVSIEAILSSLAHLASKAKDVYPGALRSCWKN